MIKLERKFNQDTEQIYPEYIYQPHVLLSYPRNTHQHRTYCGPQNKLNKTQQTKNSKRIKNETVFFPEFNWMWKEHKKVTEKEASKCLRYKQH